MSRRRQQGDKSAALHELCLSLASCNTSNPNKVGTRIAKFSAAELAGAQPLPLSHAAALGGREDAVRVLLAHGVPISLADGALAEVSVVRTLFNLADVCVGALGQGNTALALAARLGHASVVRELLAAGANPNAGDPMPLAMVAHYGKLYGNAAATTADIVRQLLAAGADPSAGSVPPLAAAARLSAQTASAAAVIANIVRQLLAAGADVIASAVLHAPLAHADARCTDAASMLLSEIFAHSRAGLLLVPRTASGAAERASALRSLLSAATVLDDVTAFCHFAAAIMQLAQPWPSAVPASFLDSLPVTVLRLALRAGSHGMLRFTQREAADQAGKAAPAAGETSPVVAAAEAAVQRAMVYVRPLEAAAATQLLADSISEHLERLVVEAAFESRTVELQLLLDGGQRPTLHALSAATVRTQNLEALRMLLAAGLPAVPTDVVAFDRYGAVEATPYISTVSSWRNTCPLLAILLHRNSWQYHTRRRAWRSESVSSLPTSDDVELLPLLEALVGAGYSPAVYHDVEVLHERAHAPLRYERFDPAAEDARLLLGGQNKWLWPAVQRPDWSPSQHPRFLPSFRAAVRTLLLTAHRVSRSGACDGIVTGGTQAGKGRLNLQHVQRASAAVFLGSLPQELLPRIVGLAAYPLSAWAALDVARA